MKFLFLLGFLFIQFDSNALDYIATSKDACTPVDFRDVFQLKMRNQRHISWCYAHTAADLLQFTYQIPEQISAADIAINYNTRAGIPKFINFFKQIFSRRSRIAPQTGFIAIAIKKIQNEGSYCPESVFPSETWTKVSLVKNTSSEIELIDAIAQMWNIQKLIQSGAISSAEDLPWYLKFRNIDPNKFFELLKNNSKSKVLEKIRVTACEGNRKPFPRVPFLSHFNLSGMHSFQRVNASFDRGMPVSVDFFSGVFDNYDHYKNKIEDLHTVLLYGRKYDASKNECTYLMKNTEGENCDHYASPLDKQCEKGYLWFPERKMFDVMTSRLILERV